MTPSLANILIRYQNNLVWPKTGTGRDPSPPSYSKLPWCGFVFDVYSRNQKCTFLWTYPWIQSKGLHSRGAPLLHCIRRSVHLRRFWRFHQGCATFRSLHLHTFTKFTFSFVNILKTSIRFPYQYKKILLWRPEFVISTTAVIRYTPPFENWVNEVVDLSWLNLRGIWRRHLKNSVFGELLTSGLRNQESATADL